MSSSSSSSCLESCGSQKRSSCSTLSCINRNRGECMLVRQFLDFNPTGPVYAMQVIPYPTCMQVEGDCKSCNRLGLRFQEMKPPYFVEVARQGPCNECEWVSQSSQCSQSSQRSRSNQRTSTSCSSQKHQSHHKKSKNHNKKQ